MCFSLVFQMEDMLQHFKDELAKKDQEILRLSR